MRLLALVGILAIPAVSFARSAQSDTLAPGFDVANSFAAQELLTVAVSNGETVVFTPDALTVFGANGTPTRTLTTFAPPVTPLMLAVDPNEEFFLYGVANQGTYRIDAAGQTTTFLSPLVGASADFDGPESAVLVVPTPATFRWFVYRLALDTGAATRLAEVPGLFGTLAASPTGEVVVAYDGGWKSPPAPGWEVARFAPGALDGGTLRTIDDATPLVNGLEVVGALAIDPFDGRVFVGEQSTVAAENRIRSLRPGTATLDELVTLASPDRVRSLQVLPGDGRASFDAFQPAVGATLAYLASADATQGPARLDRLTTARPELELTGPGAAGTGPFTLTVRGGPPGGAAVVFYGPSASFDPLARVLSLTVPLFVGLDLGSIVRVPGLVSLDADGTGSVLYDNSTGTTGAFALQAVLLDASGALAGSSAPAFL